MADAAARPTWGRVPPAATRSSRAGRRTRDALAWSANGIVLLDAGPNRSASPFFVVARVVTGGRLLATATNEGLYVIDLAGEVQASVGGASVRPVGVFTWQRA